MNSLLWLQNYRQSAMIQNEAMLYAMQAYFQMMNSSTTPHNHLELAYTTSP